MKPVEMRVDNYYPDDLQAIAKEDYEALPGVGGIAELIKQIGDRMPVRRGEGNDHAFIAAKAYVQVGWKNDILIDLASDKTREVINIGTMQWFKPEKGSITVAINGRYVSRGSGASTYVEIDDERTKEDFRELRWEIVE